MMSLRKSQYDDQETLLWPPPPPPSAASYGTTTTTVIRSGKGGGGGGGYGYGYSSSSAHRPDRYGGGGGGGPPIPPQSSVADEPSHPHVTLRYVGIFLGLIWIGTVAYASSLGGMVIREMQEQRMAQLAARDVHSQPVHYADDDEDEEEEGEEDGIRVVVETEGSSPRRSQRQQRRRRTQQSVAHLGAYPNYGQPSSSDATETYDPSSGAVSSTADDAGYNGNSQFTSSRSGPSTEVSAKDVTILVVYGPEYHSYIWSMAWHVALGVNSAFKKHFRAVTGRIVFGTTTNATFADVLEADAVLIGSPVINGNTHPNVQSWINSWQVESDLSRKVGGVFVTSGGMHTGAEGTLASMTRSIMSFRMMAIGGDSWDNSPYGAAAAVFEEPFGNVRRDGDFHSKCYQTKSVVHPHFLRKAWDLGERVANVTFALKNSTLWNR